MVDVVRFHADLGAEAVLHAVHASVESNDVLDRRDDILEVEHALTERAFETKLLVDLVAADLREVVALVIEVEVVEHRLASIAAGRFARALLAVDVHEGLVLRLDLVLLARGTHRFEFAELLEDVALGHAERLEEGRHGLLALTVDAHTNLVALVDLEFEPCAARGDDLRAKDVLVARLVDALFEVHAG